MEMFFLIGNDSKTEKFDALCIYNVLPRTTTQQAIQKYILKNITY